jgi:TolB-like protein/AraC-like DNA-binding protein
MSDAFFKRMAEIVEANLGNEQFGVEDLVREIGLSRSQVHRKLHEATGQSISQFIREIRLQRAQELLVDGTGTASEIAFKVGFGSPTYFNKCFVEHFGYTPGEAKSKAASTSIQSNRNTHPQPHKSRLLIISALILILVSTIWIINKKILSSNVPADGTKDIKKNAIAVLYFDNISGDPSQDYLSDGVTDEIISRLTMIRGLRIPGISSVKPFKTKSIPLSEIANQLDVDIILEGSVKKSGSKLRITARLIDVPNNLTLWTEVYERNYATSDIFEIQSSIATSVARRFQLIAPPGIGSTRPPTQSIEAYDLFLRATTHTFPWGIGMPVNQLELAESQLKQAIKIDPEFARAYLDLATIFNFKYLATPEGKTKKDSIRTLVKTAIAKDPYLVEGYIELASITSSETHAANFLSAHNNLNDSTWRLLKKAYDLDPVKGLLGFGVLFSTMGNWPTSVQCFNEVIRISPDNSVALRSKAVIFASMNLPDSSQKYLALAEKSDPTSPGLAFDEIMSISLMMHKYVLNESYVKFHERVARYFQEDQQAIDYRMGIAYLFGRRYLDAEKYYKTSGYRDMDVGLLLLKTGRVDSGKLVLKQALEVRNRMKERTFLFDFVRIYAVLGQNKEAVSYLKKSISAGFRDLGWIVNDPFMDYLRDDPEYKAVLGELLDYNKRMFDEIKDLENETFDVEQLRTK